MLGWPVSHSLSPRLHGYWLKQYGISGSYEALAVEPKDLQKTLRGLSEQNFRGVNLTIPHKETALSFVDEVDENARRIGAVNTVIIDKGRLLGRNTDAYGFMMNLKSQFKATPGKALVLGAGGAARAVCAGLLDDGWKVTLAARDETKAENFSKKFDVSFTHWNKLNHAMSDMALLINTTPLGMKSQPPLNISLDALPRTAAVCDIVYAPEKTAETKRYSDPTYTDLLARGKTAGHPVITGLGMLLYQAQPAFEAWFGVKPEVTQELYNHVLEAL